MKALPLHLVVLLSSTLVACATQTPTAGTSPVALATDVGCTIFPRLNFDRLKDTSLTIAGIKDYDHRRDNVCGVGK